MNRRAAALLLVSAHALAGCNCPSYFRPFHGRVVDRAGAPVTDDGVSSTDDGGAIHAVRTDGNGVFHVLATDVRSGHGYGGNEACIPQRGETEPGIRACGVSHFEVPDGEGELDLGTILVDCVCAVGMHALGTWPESCGID